MESRGRMSAVMVSEHYPYSQVIASTELCPGSTSERSARFLTRNSRSGVDMEQESSRAQGRSVTRVIQEMGRRRCVSV